jgi:hypothetical protein
MHSSDGTAAFLPTPTQELLLKACLFEGDEATAAWRAWRTATSLDNIDAGSVRLLAMLAQNMRRLAVEEPAFGKYSGVQRRTWARNQLLIRGAALASQQLLGARIPTMVLKGIVLVSRCYNGLSLRPMGNVDLLVPRNDALRAIDVMQLHGWRMRHGGSRPHRPADFATIHAYPIEHPANPEILVDVHWRLLWARFSDESEAELWRRATRFEISGVELLAPSAADMLVHICAHGARWNGLHSVRWVVDAALLMRTDAIDWAHFVAQTERLGLALPIVSTLGYLRSAMRVPVPDAVMRTLKQSPVTPIERLLHRTQLRSPEQRGFLDALRLHHHIARHELVQLQGLVGYWHYFLAKRGERSLQDVASWVYQRLSRGSSS